MTTTQRPTHFKTIDEMFAATQEDSSIKQSAKNIAPITPAPQSVRNLAAMALVRQVIFYGLH